MKNNYKKYHDLANRLGLICGKKYRNREQRVFHTYSLLFDSIPDATRNKCLREFYNGFWCGLFDKNIAWDFNIYKNINIHQGRTLKSSDGKQKYQMTMRIEDDLIRSGRFQEYLFTSDSQQQFDELLKKQLQEEIDQMLAKAEANKTYVYFIGNKEHGFIKVGISRKDSFCKRIGSIQTSCPFKIKKYKAIQINERSKALMIEGKLHQYLKDHGNHSNGEWFYNDQKMQQLMSMKKSEIIKRFAK